MTVWYLENQDCSGVFSTREKAAESFRNCAKRCGWRNVRVTDDWGYDIIYAFEWKDLDGVWHETTSFIQSYELDEDNG